MGALWSVKAKAGVHDRVGTFDDAMITEWIPKAGPKCSGVRGVEETGTEGHDGSKPAPVRVLGRDGRDPCAPGVMGGVERDELTDRRGLWVVVIDVQEEEGIRRTGGVASAIVNNDVFHGMTSEGVSPRNADLTPPCVLGMFVETVHVDGLMEETLLGESTKGRFSACEREAGVAIIFPPACFGPEVAVDPGGAIGDATVCRRFIRER